MLPVWCSASERRNWIKNLKHYHTRHAEQISLEIIKQWLISEGGQPVTWRTVVEVLCDVGLTTLASDIADIKLSRKLPMFNTRKCRTLWGRA